MFKILYGNTNPFEGLAPTPLVSRDVAAVHFGRKAYDVETFTLEGTLTGLCEAPTSGDFPFFWERVNSLYSNFSKPFQNFSIVEDLGSGSGVLFDGKYAIPRSIDIDDSVFSTMVKFTVTLDVFDAPSFSGFYGVAEPDQEFSFESNADGTININKKTSAKGFNTASGGLENAIAFVQSMTGLDTAMKPLFLNSSGLEYAILLEVNENINRMEGSYEVNESWLYDIHGRRGGYSTHKTRTSIEQGDFGVTISIEGDLTGSKNASIQNVRSDYNGINHYAAAEEIYNTLGFSGVLYPTPIGQRVTENTNEKNLTFSMQFSDTITEDPYLVDSISVNWDSESNKHCVNASVSIRSTDPCRSAKWQKVNDFYNSFNIVSWIDERLDELGYDLTFPSKANSESSTFDERGAVISMNASVCEKKIVIPNHFSDFNYTIQIVPAMPIYVPLQGLNCGGAWTVQKFPGKRRKTLTIQGEGTIKSCSTKEAAVASLRDYINGVKLVHLSLNDTFLTGSNIKYGNGANDKKIYFSFSWNENDELIFDASDLDPLTPP